MTTEKPLYVTEATPIMRVPKNDKGAALATPSVDRGAP